jgi:hypothetical protein
MLVAGLVAYGCGGTDSHDSHPTDGGSEAGGHGSLGGEDNGAASGTAGSAVAGTSPVDGGAGGVGGASTLGGSGGSATAGEAGATGVAGTAGEGGSSGEGGASGSGGAGGDGSVPPFAGGCSAVSLLLNCGFETPVATAGNFVLKALGETLDGWTVVGASGNVATLSTGFVSEGFFWPAQEQNQTLDLTGVTNTATGVSQTVTTTLGSEYQLSFWLGNVVHSGTYGTTSTVVVQVDGQEILRVTNADGAGTTSLAWKQYALAFTAAATSTTIVFLNGDGAADHSNALDNVVLRKL